MQNEDNKWMLQALFLTYIYKGTTSPNPTVGAVLTDKNGQYLGSGITKPAGGFHAERELLSNLDIEQTRGGTLYVTLEPCCFKGRTPACTDIIIEKQISKVVIATLDPNPQVSGRGIKILHNAGIQIEVGILEAQAKAINQDFFYAITHKKPFVFAKLASSLDGCLATHNGDSQWISNPKGRNISHILRYRCDAILVGANTVIKDNPTLNARLGKTSKSLYRIVLDRSAKIPLDLKLFTDEQATLWVVDIQHKKNPLIEKFLCRKNKEILFIDFTQGFEPLLEYLYQVKNIISLMVEGGSIILGQFMEQQLLNSVFIFYGNMFLGNGLKIFPMEIDQVRTAPILKHIQVKTIQDQFLVFGNVL